jgi:hypothetical protein
VTIGQPVQIPRGAELLITLAPGADRDWFYTWSAPGNMIDGSAEKTERFRLMRSATIRPVRRPVSNQSFTSPPGETGYTWEWSGVGAFGHLVTSGSGSAMVQVPEGAALKVRAYKLKEAPGGGGASTAGDIKTYCQQWELYDTYFAGNYYVFGSSPAFGNFTIGYSITPIFGGVYAPHGWVVHKAKCNEGGAAYIAAASPAWNDYIAAVLYESARVPAPAPEDPTVYLIETEVIPEPGYELASAEWDESGPAGRHSSATGSRSVDYEMELMLRLEIEVRVDGGGNTPADAGYGTVEIAKAWYSRRATEYVQLQANAHCGFSFSHWSGDGDAYPDNGHDQPSLGNPMSLSNPDVPVTENPVWLAVDKDRTITAHFREKATVVAFTNVTEQQDPVLGSLYATYTWTSSTGNEEDLQGQTVLEILAYDPSIETEAMLEFVGSGLPASVETIWFPNEMVPCIRRWAWAEALDLNLVDHNGRMAMPTDCGTSCSWTVRQWFVVLGRCEPYVVGGPFEIIRGYHQESGNWRYCVTKHGGPHCIDVP